MNGRTDTDRALDRIANHVDDIAAFTQRLAMALERLVVIIESSPVVTTLDADTDGDDMDDDAAMDAAMNELNAWPR